MIAPAFEDLIAPGIPPQSSTGAAAAFRTDGTRGAARGTMTDGRLEATSNIITATDSTVELDLSWKLRVARYTPRKVLGHAFQGPDPTEQVFWNKPSGSLHLVSSPTVGHGVVRQPPGDRGAARGDQGAAASRQKVDSWRAGGLEQPALPQPRYRGTLAEGATAGERGEAAGRLLRALPTAQQPPRQVADKSAGGGGAGGRGGRGRCAATGLALRARRVDGGTPAAAGA